MSEKSFEIDNTIQGSEVENSILSIHVNRFGDLMSLTETKGKETEREKETDKGEKTKKTKTPKYDYSQKKTKRILKKYNQMKIVRTKPGNFEKELEKEKKEEIKERVFGFDKEKDKLDDFRTEIEILGDFVEKYVIPAKKTDNPFEDQDDKIFSHDFKNEKMYIDIEKFDRNDYTSKVDDEDIKGIPQETKKIESCIMDISKKLYTVHNILKAILSEMNTLKNINKESFIIFVILNSYNGEQLNIKEKIKSLTLSEVYSVIEPYINIIINKVKTKIDPVIKSEKAFEKNNKEEFKEFLNFNYFEDTNIITINRKEMDNAVLSKGIEDIPRIDLRFKEESKDIISQRSIKSLKVIKEKTKGEDVSRRDSDRSEVMDSANNSITSESYMRNKKMKMRKQEGFLDGKKSSTLIKSSGKNENNLIENFDVYNDLNLLMKTMDYLFIKWSDDLDNNLEEDGSLQKTLKNRSINKDIPHYHLFIKFLSNVENYFKDNYPTCCSKQVIESRNNSDSLNFCFDCLVLFCIPCSYAHKGHETFCFESFKGDFILERICKDLKTEINFFLNKVTNNIQEINYDNDILQLFHRKKYLSMFDFLRIIITEELFKILIPFAPYDDEKPENPGLQIGGVFKSLRKTDKVKRSFLLFTKPLIDNEIMIKSFGNIMDKNTLLKYQKKGEIGKGFDQDLFMNDLPNLYDKIITEYNFNKKQIEKNIKSNKDLLDDIFSNQLYHELDLSKNTMASINNANFNIAVNDINLFICMEDSPRERYNKIFSKEELGDNFSNSYFKDIKEKSNEYSKDQQKMKNEKINTIIQTFMKQIIKPVNQKYTNFIKGMANKIKSELSTKDQLKKSKIVDKIETLTSATQGASPKKFLNIGVKTIKLDDTNLKSTDSIFETIIRSLKAKEHELIHDENLVLSSYIQPKLRIIMFYFEDLIKKVRNYGSYIYKEQKKDILV